MDRWKGKVALVSGASVGIGFEIAKELAKAGMKVVGFSRNPDKLKALADELSSAGAAGCVIPKKCDLGQEEQVVALFEEIRKELGGVDMCVNNAGLAFSSPVLSQSTAEWREMLDVNVIGLLMMTREYVKQMEERGPDLQGHIVNINSMSGHRMSPTTGFNFYTATKYAVTALTEGTRMELRMKKSKIRVTGISPGLVRTEFRGRSQRVEDIEASKKAYDDICEEVLEAEDIAAAVLYAVSAPQRVDVNDVFIRPTTQLG